MKLNWFSPLAPARSEIAHYTARTVAALRRYAEVTFWTDQAEWDTGLEQLAPVRRFDGERPCWKDLQRADLSIYHIGNHTLHGGIWEMSRRLPGIVVLHDLRLHDLFYCLFLEHHRLDRYLGCLELCYGDAGRAAGERFCRDGMSKDYMAENYPLTSLAVEEAAGVVVHTQEAFEQAVPSFACPVTQLNLPFPATPRGPGLAVRKASIGGSGPFRLIVFGHLSRNRRLNAVLQALASFPDRQRFYLDIYGSVPDARFLDGQITGLDLRQQVTVHGFVPEETLDAALDRADLAINLRYPSMGEASSTQLRIWDHALPSLVTAVGWYGTLPDTIVGFVQPEDEITDIHAHLAAFLAEPARFVRQGEEGRRRLEACHSPDRYARDLVKFAASAQRFLLRRVTGKLVERVGAELSAWSSIKMRWDVYRNVAKEIRRLAS